MRLESLTRPELIVADLPGADRPTALRALSEHVAGVGTIRDADDLYNRLWEREQLGSTGIGSGVAIPHCKLKGLERVILAIGICRREIDYDAPDDLPVRLLFLIVSPESSPAEHLQSLAIISKWVKADEHVERILRLEDPAAIYELLQQESSE